MAYSAATESVDLAVVTGQEAILPFGLQALAHVEAVLGHDGACRDHANAALAAAGRSGLGSIEVYASAALGLLELGRGRPNEAIAPLETAARRVRADGASQAPVQWAGDLIEAYAHSGRVSEAQRLVDELAAESARTGQRWAAACLARPRGMLAAEGEFERCFEEALAIHEQDPSRFEVARTELCLGQRRRRARRRADARKALRSALASFEALGAAPWAEQARGELRATGEAPTPASEGSLRDLTPQELQVALIVAKGATNNETAAALFLSPKTVEFHLHNTYRKLAVRSRAELVRMVGLAAS
jgi:DNA-binding CsgD family transcriptional regulator